MKRYEYGRTRKGSKRITSWNIRKRFEYREQEVLLKSTRAKAEEWYLRRD